MKFELYITVLITCSILQVSSHKYKNLFKNLFDTPPMCPHNTACVGVISCYHTLSACGFKINLNQFVMEMNKQRCSNGNICCPLGPKCYKRIKKLFPHIIEPIMGKLIMSTTMLTTISHTTTKPPETTTKSTEITIKIPEITTKPPEITTKSTEITIKIPEITTKPPEITTKFSEITTKPPESTTKTTEPLTLPSATTMKPDTVTLNKNYTGHPNFHLLAGEHCGFGLVSRIAYGEEVAPGELPWLVMLMYRENKKLVFRCGGALVSARYVLTAAHCIIQSNKAIVLTSVRLGEINLSTENDCVDVEEESNYLDFDFTAKFEQCFDKPQDIKIELAIPHPKFKLNSILKGFPHDIGLIRLKREADLSPFVKPICIMGLASHTVFNQRNVDLQNFEVAGWGMVNMSMDPLSDELRKVNVNSTGRDMCSESLKRKINECQLCAGGMRGNACRGDSGGPLMAKVMGNPGESCPLLIGVISYGTIDCGYTIPSVFSDVSCYLQWILDNVKE